MAGKRGCFRTGCLGCLGLLAVSLLILGIMALVAWRGAADRDIVQREISAPIEMAAGEGESAGTGTAVESLPAGKGGKLVLILSQGGFHLHPGEPGAPLTIKADFDDDIYNLEDRFETLPDSTWVYQVRFYRTIGGMQAMLRALTGGGHETNVHVFIPPDMPLELVVDTKEGGLAVDLGGLWLTSATFRCAKGGFALDVGKPLREPMDSFRVFSRMGGLDIANLGNASPDTLVVSGKMGGINVDLDGLWRNDCLARLSMRMGGMAVSVPDNVIVEGADIPGGAAGLAAAEVPLPVLRLHLSQSMGNIEVAR